MSVSIGIDPGKTTGLAVYDRDHNKLVRLESTTFWGAYSTVLTEYHDVFAVVIEVPKTKHNWHKDKSGITAHNIGRVCREAELLAIGLELAGLNVITQHPKGKINHNMFCRITRWSEGRTNDHTRDAGMLCYGV